MSTVNPKLFYISPERKVHICISNLCTQDTNFKKFMQQARIGYFQNFGIFNFFFFFGNCLRIFVEFCGKSLGNHWGFLWKVISILKELTCVSRLWLLSRFCLNAQGRQI